MCFLIVGLGNPGAEYKGTRHNIGFEVIDLCRRQLGVRLSNRSFQSKNIRTRFQGRDVILLCPLTFMNRSGLSVSACAVHHKVEIRNILIIHDDLDLTAGRIKIVRGGGPGGHKGVESIILHLGTDQVPRVKIGIGRPCCGESIEDYVLAPFYGDEIGVMQKVVRTAAYACALFVSEGFESAMNKINCQNLANKEVRS